MTTIVTRAGKGSALTWTEGDSNFTNLNTAKLENVVEDTTPQLGGNLDVNGNSIVSASNGNITIAPNGTGKVVISGDLQVDGTTTTINSTTMDVDDINITVAKGAANAAAANGAGLTVEGPTTAATITYASADDSWNLNKKTSVSELQVDNININGNTLVSTDTNGDITITPNGTGSVIIDGNEFPQTQGTAGQILVADGAGLLEWKNQEKLTAVVYNADSVTINKGDPVYVFSAFGDQISVKLALNTGDATSAQTLGLANESIAPTATGVVICQGVMTNVDTAAYAAGDPLYLGSTAGSKTTTKPYAPNHLVYLGFVEKVNASSGRIYVRVQNGYELDEIHNVQITTTPVDGQVLAYEAASSLWKPTTVTSGGLNNVVEDTTPQLGGDLDVNGKSIVSVSNGNIMVVPHGTGNINLTPASGKVVISATSFPTGVGTNGQVLTTDGTGNASWSTVSGGAAALDDLTDVVITAAATNDVLVYNGTNWVDTAASTLTVGTAGVADTVTLTADNTTNATNYPLFANAAAGSLSPRTDTGFTYNPSNGVLTAVTFSGAATQINVASAVSANYQLALTPASTIGTVSVTTDTLLAYNATTDVLSVPSITASATVTAKTISESTIYTATYATPFVPNVTNGNIQKVTLTGNLTFNGFTNPVTGQTLTLLVYGGVGYTTVTSTMLFAGGNKTLSGTTGCLDVITVTYTDGVYLASIARGFA